MTATERTKLITELAENLEQVDKDISDNNNEIEKLQDYHFNLKRKRQDIVDEISELANNA